MVSKSSRFSLGLLIVVVLGAMILTGCSSANPLQAKLVGSWSNVAEDGSSGKAEFYDDNTFLLNADGDEKKLHYTISGEDYPAIILIADIGDEENYYKSEFSFESDERLIFKLEDGTEITMTRDEVQ